MKVDAKVANFDAVKKFSVLKTLTLFIKYV